MKNLTPIQKICRENRWLKTLLTAHMGVSFTTINKAVENWSPTIKTKLKMLKALVELWVIKEWEYTFITLYK